MPSTDDGLPRLRALNSPIGHYALATFVELGLADELARGRADSATLTARCGANPAGVDKLLLTLSRHDVVHAAGDGWTLGPLGEFLTSDHPLGAWRHVHPDGAQARLNRAFAGLGHAVRTGRSGYEVVYGRSLWADLEADPELGRSFANLMVAGSDPFLSALATSYDWGRAREVLDVGGGRGNAVARLVEHREHLRGTVLDLPHLADSAGEWLAGAGMGDRVRFVAADFFEPLPVRGDTALLVHVLHDWDDEQAETILRRCADAVGDDGRVLVVEVVRGLDPDSAVSDAERDLLMYVLFATEERTHGQWETVIGRAGLELRGMTHLHAGHYVLECARRA